MFFFFNGFLFAVTGCEEMPCRVVGLSEMVAETLRCLCNIAKLLKNYNNPGVIIRGICSITHLNGTKWQAEMR